MTNENTNEKPRYVKVVRYVRPTDFVFFDECALNDNMFGVTFAFTLDYESKKVSVSWSICKEDNFNKDIGRFLAWRGKYTHTYDLKKVDEERGLVNSLLGSLAETFDDPEIEFFTYSEFQTFMLAVSRKIGEK